MVINLFAINVPDEVASTRCLMYKNCNLGYIHVNLHILGFICLPNWHSLLVLMVFMQIAKVVYLFFCNSLSLDVAWQTVVMHVALVILNYHYTHVHGVAMLGVIVEPV